MKILMIIAMAICLGGCTYGSSASAGSPLTCQLIPNQLNGVANIVDCNVVDQTVTITNVVANRGNCPSPVLTPDQIAWFWNEVRRENNGAAAIEKTVSTMIAQGYDPGYLARGYAASVALMGAPSFSGIPTAPQIQLAVRAFLNNPSRVWTQNGTPIPYKYGDKAQFVLAACDNILEYTITANGADYTWEAEVQ